MVEARDDELLIPLDKLRELGEASFSVVWLGHDEDAGRLERLEHEISSIAAEIVVAMGLQDTPREGFNGINRLGKYVHTYLGDQGVAPRADQVEFINRILRDVGREEYQRQVKQQYERPFPPSSFER